MNTWNTQWKNQWKKTLALSCTAFLLGGSAWGYAAPTVTAASSAAHAANPQDAPMPLPLTEEEVSAQQLADAEYMALLWMRTSAEYRALCYQGYNAALMAIDRAQANPAARSGKPLAIVLDCDETVTDNTRAMAAAAAAGNGRYDALWWRATVHEARSEAMPGAVEFLNEVARHGVVQGQLHGEGLPALLYGAVVASDADIRFFPPKQQGAGHEQHQPGGEQSPVQRERGIKPDKQGLDKGECYPAAPLVFVRDDHCRGTGTVCRSCASRASVLMSSISASAERCTRWRRTAGASALMSSGIT